MDKSLLTALKRLAKGCEESETVEEYATDCDGVFVKTKERVKTRRRPPDVAAIRLLLSLDKGDKARARKMSDAELIAECERLIGLMKKGER